MYCVKVEIEKPSLKRDLNENTNSADVFGRALQRFSARFYKFGHTNFIKFVRRGSSEGATGLIATVALEKTGRQL